MKTTVIKITKMWLITVAVSIFFIACGKDDEPVIPKSTEATISSLSFSTAQNNVLYQDVTATINESTKTISATVTVIVPQADLNKQLGLVPNISFSNKATIAPANSTAINVGDTAGTTTYTVTAEDGTTTQNYTLTTTVKYINQTATEVVVTSHLATLYAIKDNNPNATGFVANLDLDNANATAIRNSFDDRIILNANKEIVELNINSSNLDVLPAEIGNLTTLTKLYASGNNFTELPETIGNLTNLTNANFDGSDLEALPAGFANLTSLEYLSLNNNKLETMPEELFSLTALKSLYYNGNSLNVLPAGIGNLTALEFLSVSFNNLEAFPTQIGNLTALKILYAGTNNLKPAGFPAEMANMSALVDVYLLGGNSELTGEPADLPSVVCNFFKNIRSNGGSVRTNLSLNCN